MSEKNLTMRNKLVSKMNSKINHLTQSLQLLVKVDNKLFNSQHGGTNANVLSALAKVQMIKKSTPSTEDLERQTRELNDQLHASIKVLQDTIKKLADEINGMEINQRINFNIGDHVKVQKFFNTSLLNFEPITNALYANHNADVREQVNELKAIVEAADLPDDEKEQLKDVIDEKVREIIEQAAAE